MSWNSGAGRPIRFRCSACRRERSLRFCAEMNIPANAGRRSRVRLTGRVRVHSQRTARHGAVMREYRCLDCGHIGWSSHDDLFGAMQDRPR